MSGFGEVQRTVDRDAVVVEEHDQLGEAQMAGKRNGFVTDAFHQVAVAGDDEGHVIDHIVAELRVHQPLGKCHADGCADALAEWAGGRLDARRVAVFRMAGCL